MKWVPTPTESYSDLRLEQAGERAEVLHHRAWAWAGHQETDGFIPAAMVARLCPASTKARIDALVREGVWEAVDGGYKLVDWEPIVADMRSLQRRREADAERQRRKREKEAREAAARATARDRTSRDGQAPVDSDSNRDGTRDETRDVSRGPSRDSPHAEENRDNPPNPPHSGGDDEPIPDDWSPGQCYRHPDRPGRRCRRCGTTDRQLAAAAAERAAQAAAAELADLIERRNALEWCGDADCDPKVRKTVHDGRLIGCPVCNPDVVIGPLPRPALTVVPDPIRPRRAAGPAF